MKTFDFNKEHLRCRVVMNSPVGEAANNQCQQSLQDEDPRPSSLASYSSHLRDGSCKKPTKGASGSCGREEECHAEATLMTLVPHSDVEANTREETTFSNAKEDTSC